MGISSPSFTTQGSGGGEDPALSTNLLLKPNGDFGALQYKLINFYVLINGSH